MHRIEAKLELICNPYFRRFDVALHNSRMLVLLLESGKARVGDLVSSMVLPQSTISHQLRELEKRKLIRRTPGVADSRSVIVELTARGKRVARQCNDLSAHVFGAMVDGISQPKLERLRRELRKIYANLDDLHAIETAAGRQRRRGRRTEKPAEAARSLSAAQPVNRTIARAGQVPRSLR